MEDGVDTDDFASIFGDFSEHDHASRPPSPQYARMDEDDLDEYGFRDEDEDEPMLDQGSSGEPDVVSLTLDEFVSRAQELCGLDKAAFSKFVLTGIYDNTQHQVDPIKDTLEDDQGVQALRDFDSVLGIHKDVCVSSFLAMYPVSKRSDTLSRNIHIKYSFSNQRVRSNVYIISHF
jgi:hypothetical protein